MASPAHDSNSLPLETFNELELDDHPRDATLIPAVYTSSGLPSEDVDAHAEFETRRNETSLPPVDSGYRAWAFLAGVFMVEGVGAAFPTSYGIFLAAYMDDPHLGSQKNAASILPLGGTLSVGIIYCSSPLMYAFINRYPQHRRISMFLGMFMCWLSLLAASYIRKIWMLVLFQGVMYGVGVSILYAPVISYMSEWFVRRRGLASGVIFTGGAMGGLVLPLVLSPLLRNYGPSITLRILSIAVLILLLAVVPFVRGRLPTARVHGPAARESRRAWLKDRRLWFIFTVNTAQGLGYFVPTIWLPTYAAAIGLSKPEASIVMSLLNGFTGLSLLGYGALSDHFSPWALGMSSLFMASFSAFVLWGVLSTSLAGILVFGAAYGALAGGWSSLWTSFAKPIAMDDPSLSTTIFGILMFSRGLGNVISTPISTSLFGRTARTSNFSAKIGLSVDGGNFEGMIFYVGSVLAGAGIMAGAGWVAEMRRSSQPTGRSPGLRA